MAAPSKVDWTAIKNEYISTRTTYAKLAEKYGVSSRSVERMSSKENWKDQRAAYVKMVTEKFMKKSTDVCVKKLMKFGDNAAAKALEMAEKVMADEDQFKKHTAAVIPLNGGDADIIEKVMTVYNMKAFRDFTASMKDWVAIFRNVYNLPTQPEMEAQRVAAERLELEKKKANDSKGADTIRVVFDQDIEELAK